MVRIFLRKVSKERRLKEKIKKVQGILVAGNRIMIVLNDLPTKKELDEIIKILSYDEWELVSPSKSKFNYRQFIRENKLRRKRSLKVR